MARLSSADSSKQALPVGSVWTHASEALSETFRTSAGSRRSFKGLRGSSPGSFCGSFFGPRLDLTGRGFGTRFEVHEKTATAGKSHRGGGIHAHAWCQRFCCGCGETCQVARGCGVRGESHHLQSSRRDSVFTDFGRCIEGLPQGTAGARAAVLIPG